MEWTAGLLIECARVCAVRLLSLLNVRECVELQLRTDNNRWPQEKRHQTDGTATAAGRVHSGERTLVARRNRTTWMSLHGMDTLHAALSALCLCHPPLWCWRRVRPAGRWSLQPLRFPAPLCCAPARCAGSSQRRIVTGVVADITPPQSCVGPCSSISLSAAPCSPARTR